MPNIQGIPVGEGRSLEIIIDHLPYRELSPNTRVHWSERAKWVKVAREEMGWLAKSAIQNHTAKYPNEWDKPMMKARISYEFHVADHRRRDLDNLYAATKAWTDGLIEAGVIFFDDSAHLKIGSIKTVNDAHEATVIAVEEV